MSTKPCKLNIQLVSNKPYETVYNNETVPIQSLAIKFVTKDTLSQRMCRAYFIHQVTCIFTQAFFSLTSTASISTTNYH